MKKKNKKKLNIINTALVVIQIILSVSLFAMATYFQVLPTWLLFVLGAMLLLTSSIVHYSLSSKKTSRLNKTLGRILSVLLSSCLILGNVFVYNIISTVNTVTGASYKTDAMSVIVLKESGYQSISDITDLSFGVHATMDLDNSKYAVSQINIETGATIQVSSYDDFSILVDSLYNAEVGAIIINEAFRSIIEDEYVDFSVNTTILHQIDKKTIVENEVEKGFDVTKEPFNVYLSGIDSYGPVSGSSRSDVNMIVSINPSGKQILLTSIPRDFYVPLACQNGAMDKLTHAGVYGVDCSKRTLEQFMGIEIPYYARVNFSSLVNIVDALGGIEVYSEYSFIAVTGDVFNAGMNQMNGALALTFSRERKGLPGGDRDRGKNQQAVIQAIIDKAKSPAIVANYTKVIDAVSGSFQTNMSSKDISKLIKMQLNDMADWTITTANLNGSGATMTTFTYGAQPLYVMIPDMATVADAQAKIKAIFGTESE